MTTQFPAPITDTALAGIRGVRHAFFTRQGGVSQGVYGSLNMGYGSDDEREAITENRRLAMAAIDLPLGALNTVYQEHGTEVAIADRNWDPKNAPRADAMVTDRPGIAIGILTADCVPVLFAGETPDGRKVIGAAHAGWRGALSGVVEATVDAMIGLGAKPKRIRAVVGPAISQGAYEVGQNYRQHFIAKDPDAAAFFVTDEGAGEPHFDLSGYAVERLARAGVGDIVDLRLCTYNDESRLFSYRRSQRNAENDYGRQISAIVLA